MKKRSRFDWRWLVIVVLLCASFGLALYYNLNTKKEVATDIRSSLAIDNSDLNINWDRYQTTDIELSESLNITKSGTYHLTGTLENGNITIDAGVSEVRLILDNVTISSDGPAILCRNAENLVIKTIGENTLTDSENYNTNDEDIRSVIYSKSDLAFEGTGILNLNAKYQDGIIGKDDVKFISGDYNINAKSNAILGKDSVYVVGGNFNLISDNDSVKVTNTDDFGKGFILIENASFDINSLAKGFEVTRAILIDNGSFEINTFDDAIHSDNFFGMTSGHLVITSGNDAIHADNEITIDGGQIEISKSYEGIEAQVVTINNGELSIQVNDDGINAGNSIDETTEGDQPVPNYDEKTDENCKVVFNGGTTYINSVGDGIDSNGHVYINDGKITIDGPTSDKNGALDSGLGFATNGGTVIAVGASGQASNLSEDSNVPNISVYFPELLPSDTKFEIKNSKDELVLSHTSAKSFNHLAATTPYFILGETYKIYLDDKEYSTFTISSVTTIINEKSLEYDIIK